MSRSFARILASLSAGTVLAAQAFAQDNPPVPPTGPYPPEKEDCCQDCADKESGDASQCANLPPCKEDSSVYFSIGLGRVSFDRNMDEVRAVLAPGYATLRDPRAHKTRESREYSRFYQRNPLSARRDFKLWLYQEHITADSYLPAALTADPEAGGEKIFNLGIIRQIVTDDYFADIQALSISGVRSSLPSDIQAALPATSQGFVVRTWRREDLGTKSGTYYPLPTADPTGYVVYYNPDAPTLGGKLNIIHRAKFNGTSYKTRSFCHHEDAASHDWHATTHAGLPSDTVIEDVLLDVTSYASPSDFTRVRTIKRASLSPSGTYGALQTISVSQENFDNVDNKPRLVEEIKGFGSSAPLTTRYGWYGSEHPTWLRGRKRWVQYPDKDFDFYRYSYTATGSATTYHYKPWKGHFWDAPASSPIELPGAQNCIVETRTITTYSGFQAGIPVSYSTTEVQTHVGGQLVEKSTEAWSFTTGTKIFTETKALLHTGTMYRTLSTRTGYHFDPNDLHRHEKIKWRELPDSTAETYAYTTPDSSGSYTQTIEKGAGNRYGINSGTRIITVRNKYGYTVEESVYHFHGSNSFQLSHWASVSEDFFGRPTKRVYNGDTNDYDQTVYGCCGIASFRDRRGIVTETFQDDLQRVRKEIVTAGSRVTTTETTHNGLETTVRQKAGSLDLLVSSRLMHLNGELESITTPDQDADASPEITGYAYSYPGTGGKIVTVTRPDNSTEITEYYVDGRVKSVTGSAVADKLYDYGTHSLQGGGTWTSITSPTSASPTGEWVKTSRNLGGKTFKTEYPTQIADPGTNDHSLITYYASGNGSTGKVHTVTDPDGVTVTYTYDTEGGLASVTEPMPNSAGNRVTTHSHEAVNDAEFGNSLRKVIQVNGVTTLVEVSSGDGYHHRRESLGQITTTTRSVGSGGDWTETVIRPDDVPVIRTYEDGLLESVAHQIAGSSPAAYFDTVAYTYDALGRPATSTRSRTGTTTYNAYTESGNLLSQTEPGSRTTTYTYDSMGRAIEVDAPDTLDGSGATVNNVTHTSYHPTGKVEAVWGDQTYATFRFYDEQQRMQVLRTYRNLAHGTKPGAATTGADSTVWAYDPSRGWLTGKEYADGFDAGTARDPGPSYAYTAAGRLKKRSWARGNVTRYDYDQGYLSRRLYFTGTAGVDTATDGNDAATPDIGFTYDAMGRLLNVTRGGAGHFAYTYSSTDLGLLTETPEESYLTPQAHGLRMITRKRDALRRPSGYFFGVPWDADAVSEITYGYDTAGRFSTLTYQGTPGAATPPAAETFTYGYDYESAVSGSLDIHVPFDGTGSPSSSTLPFSVSGPAHVAERSYEADRDVLHEVRNLTGTSVQSAYRYTVNAIGQRTDLDIAGLEHGSPAPGGGYVEDIAWGYDAKGQVTAADSSLGSGTSDDRHYAYDALGNRIQSRTGTASSTGGSATDYHAAAGASGSGGSALNQYGTIVTPTASIEPGYDIDGNLTDDGLDWDYIWNGENQLVSATPKNPASGKQKVEYRYDYLGRMDRQVNYTWNGSAWADAVIQRHVYDGWNRIETIYDNLYLRMEMVWGLDMSGSLQGAGGVGGMLLWRMTGSSGNQWYSHYPCYDGNGNVTDLVNASGAVAVHREYDPFGNVLRTATTAPWSLPAWLHPRYMFRYGFSTKPQDEQTGLYYYGYRHYDPVTGRWISRDPIEERGGFNLYGMLQNDAIRFIDYLGLKHGDTCKIKILVGHASSLYGALEADELTDEQKDEMINEYLDQVQSAMEDSDMCIGVTCFAADVNSRIPKEKQVSSKNPRTNDLIYPNPNNMPKDSKTVGDLYKEELENAREAAKELCKCGCESVKIIAKSIDAAGRRWVSNNVNGPVEDTGNNDDGIIDEVINCKNTKK